jgi:hypothetical protein
MLVSVPPRTDTLARGTAVKFLRLNALEYQMSATQDASMDASVSTGMLWPDEPFNECFD